VILINKKIIVIKIFLILTPFAILEIVSQFVLLNFKDTGISFFFRHFSNKIIKSTIKKEYEVNWNFSTNKMKPGKYLTKDGIVYNINSKGFRGREFTTKKEKIRIIAFGGSTTIGLESLDDQTYPAQLETLLNKNLNEYEVLNMGFGSKSLNFIRLLYFTEAHIYKPDFIIIYSNRNNIMYDAGNVDLVLKNQVFTKVHYIFSENIMIYRLMSKSYKRFMNLNLKTNVYISPYHLNGIKEFYFTNTYKEVLFDIISFAEKNNTKVILVKMAYNFSALNLNELRKYSNEDLLKNYKNDFFKKKYNLDEVTLFWSVFGTILNNQIDDFKGNKNVIIVDPREDLEKNSKNFTDIIHLTPKGNSVLASSIYQALKINRKKN